MEGYGRYYNKIAFVEVCQQSMEDYVHTFKTIEGKEHSLVNLRVTSFIPCSYISLLHGERLWKDAGGSHPLQQGCTMGIQFNNDVF